METKLLRGEQEKDLQEAARLLCAGEIVAFPTETVYGLGANALDAALCIKFIRQRAGLPTIR